MAQGLEELIRGGEIAERTEERILGAEKIWKGTEEEENGLISCELRWERRDFHVE